jgi:nitroimidazol reductase NimA-like FMN-containing flavoprotein (pyridoxamine 5'-phosphate oxidase superfamily)
MAEGSYPEFRSLTDAECVGILDRNHVGRLAFTFRDRVDIQPLHYVYDDGWLYGRTSEGAKLETLEHHQWVAFEVDDIRGPFDWESVVVRGSFYRLDDEERRDPAIAAHAIALLRSIAPETLSKRDPAPHRAVLFRISIRELSGSSSRLADPA